MSPWSTRKLIAAEVLGIVVLLAGFLPVVVFALGSLVPSAEASAMLGLFPDIPWFDARRLRWAPHAGVAFALAGLMVMFAGAAIVRRQQRVFEAMRTRRQDALRRVRQYEPADRIEPTLN